ncbi:calcium-activated chloride channel regulator 1-like [Alosa sapidissima]|uniref:calcium-activated chloride channel regulator 1-like n=1 Tax=Alosa sapidissima TaxID=34773 RepID=UPI001C098BA8|nr:calcium-activated chloride channel regulator 1-like [Alosa sapidissima]
MGLQTSGLFFVIFLSRTFGIQLDGHGYTGVLIAINPAVPEEPNGQVLLMRIEDMIKDASLSLSKTAGNRFHFKEVTILIPSNWKTQKEYKKARTERYDKAHVIIDEPNRAYGDEPYTLQYGQCGDEGQYIHLTPNFLLDDNLVYGERNKVFVHEWAHLRWGLYDEYSDEQPFYLSGQGEVEATRCSIKITGQQCGRSEAGCKNPCDTDKKTGLPTGDCIFLPDTHTSAQESIMAYPSLYSVVDFCTTETHNAEAPNRQNQMCGNRAALDVILNSSVDAGVPEPSAPFPTVYPTIWKVQRRTRVVCLVLDVSGSMQGPRILLLQQAATLFLREIIEDTAIVGIVKFQSIASIQKSLTLIDSEQTRETLVKALPTTASGGTQICQGINKALEVVKEDDQNTEGDELVLLTDGEANDNMQLCLETVKSSGATVHTIALGPNADQILQVMANKTGGIFYQSTDSIDSNALVDAFASLTTSDGNLTQQAIQLESSGKTTLDWFNGTFSVDLTVGNGTVITIIYEASPPRISIRSPSGDMLSGSDFSHDRPTKTLSLKIAGTAEVGEWHYSLLNEGSTAQAMAITVTSRAARADVPPIIVKAHMNQKSSDGNKAMVVFASVTQKGVPVIMADVTATLVSDKEAIQLQLEDKGTGADAVRHDGIYSKYFTQMKTGRYSLKVRVKNKGKARISTHRYSGAPYIPGYVVNGLVVLNPPKPPVNHEPVEVGSFSRTATGESFVVELPPGSTGPPPFPPCKITDLKAKLEGDNVTLTWTAPGDSYDQGTASVYHIHWSEDLGLLRRDFNETPAVNTSALSPQEAGSIEEYSFSSYYFNITNGTSVFFAIAAENAKFVPSEMSNIARVVKYQPPVPQQQKSTNVIAIAVSGTVAAIVVIIAVIIYIK